MTIAGVRLDGGCFTAGTELRFFKQNMDRIAVVFGRNGTGKSTIGRGFSSLAFADEAAKPLETSSEYVQVEALTLENSDVAADQSQSDSNILVYNEDFVHENVQFVEGGLGTIALIGAQGSVQAELALVEQEINDVEALVIDEATLGIASGKEAAALNKLENKLRGRWAKEDGALKGNKVSSKVPRAVDTLRHVGLDGMSVSQLVTKYSEKSLDFRNARSGSSVIDHVPTFKTEVLMGKLDTGLLVRVLPAPTGTGIAQLVAESLENHSQYVHAAHSIFQEPNVHRCPFCLQTLSPEYQSELLVAIADSIDEAAKQADTELEAAKIINFELRLPSAFSTLDSLAVKAIHQLVTDLNDQINDWNSALDKKKQALYSESNWDPAKLESCAKSLETTLEELEGKKQARNAKVQNAERFKTEALKLNQQLARAECTQEFADHTAAQTYSKDLRQQNKEYDDTLAQLKIRRKKLTEALIQVKLGADEINKQLSVIFADENRLQLVPASNDSNEPLYQILSRGKAIRPNRLSVGERNVLALCYFFTKFKEDVGNSRASGKTLIVLDDPVSSVDIENRVGIHVYLEYQFCELLKQYRSLSILVLTHDLSAARNFEKSAISAVGPLFSKEAGHSKSNKPSIRAWVLGYSVKDGVMVHALEGADSTGHARSFGRGLEEYRVLLEEVWKFAAMDGTDSQQMNNASVSMGNIMRRVLEAFGTFIYDAGSIASDTLQRAYQDAKAVDLNLALGPEFRLVLHGESHAADAVASLSAYGGGLTYSSEQLRRTARRLLALMYGLQPGHIAAYLPEAVDKIEDWEESELGIAKNPTATSV